MIKQETNSKLVQKGQTFIALVGHTVDGHDYIEEAIKNGASKVVGQKDLNLSVPYEKVNDTNKYLKEVLTEDMLTHIVINGINNESLYALYKMDKISLANLICMFINFIFCLY